MFNVFQIVIAAFLSIVLGTISGIIIRKKLLEKKIKHNEESAKQIIENAKKESASLLKEASLKSKEEFLNLKNQSDKEAYEKQREIKEIEKRLNVREENLDKKFNLLENKEFELNKKDKQIKSDEISLSQKSGDLNQKLELVKKELEKIAQMSRDEAKQELTKELIDEVKYESAKHVRQIEEEAKEQAETKAKEIIATAIQRYAGEFVTDRTVSVVTLPSDDMKGRIIGREGRNIRTLEALTGVDFIVDDTPEAVILSTYNPVRREIAKVALEKLVADGRIHPAKIEETVKRVTEEIEADIKQAGEKAVFEIGAHGLHPELIKLIGTLKYRYSYAQNQFSHALEVAHICGLLASELGINIKQAKRAGLLHDIGKAVDHEIEGPHAMIGGDFAKKYGENPKICHAIAAHHEDLKLETPLDFLVLAADSISGARPGARSEILETYVKRIEDLEKIAISFKGVERSYAIQAGRELRVMVESREINDDSAVILSKDIAKKIQQELKYPGEIKVVVIRETRSIEIAH
jgi:ribonuclease Y